MPRMTLKDFVQRDGALDASKPAAQQPSNPTSQKLVKATYYLRADQAKRLKLLAVEQDRNLSEVMREAVDAYLGPVRP